jgi:predicted RNA polymerase sigma factor
MTEQVRSEPARRRRVELVAGQVPADRRWAPGADAGDEGAHDDTLTVLFLCCHPVLTPASAIALTLRSVGGLTTGEIARISDNPLITLNRAVALAMVEGPDAGPVLLADPAPALDGRHRLYAVRAHLHELAGRRDAAVADYRAAARRTPSLPERHHLTLRAARLAATADEADPA